MASSDASASSSDTSELFAHAAAASCVVLERKVNSLLVKLDQGLQQLGLLLHRLRRGYHESCGNSPT